MKELGEIIGIWIILGAVLYVVAIILFLLSTLCTHKGVDLKKNLKLFGFDCILWGIILMIKGLFHL